MSAREWKPGDVAMVTRLGEREVAVRRPDGWWSTQHGNALFDDLPDTRRVLVIDPEDMAQVNDLIGALAKARSEDPLHAVDPITVQAALRSLLAPPKPPEPQGLGAVVRDSEGYTWIRRGPTHYIVAEGSPADLYNASRTWGEIDAVEVLSEGVRP